MWLRTIFSCFELGCHCVPLTTTCNYWLDFAISRLQLLPHLTASALPRGLHQAESSGPDISSLGWQSSPVLRANALCIELATCLLQSSGPVFFSLIFVVSLGWFCGAFWILAIQNARNTEQIAWQCGGLGGDFSITYHWGCVFCVLGCWLVGVRAWEVCRKGWRSPIWRYT